MHESESDSAPDSVGNNDDFATPVKGGGVPFSFFTPTAVGPFLILPCIDVLIITSGDLNINIAQKVLFAGQEDQLCMNPLRVGGNCFQ